MKAKFPTGKCIFVGRDRSLIHDADQENYIDSLYHSVTWLVCVYDLMQDGGLDGAIVFTYKEQKTYRIINSELEEMD